MKKVLSVLVLCAFAFTMNSQTFGTFSKMTGVALVTECETFTVSAANDSTANNLMVIAADKTGNEVTRWYFPANTLTISRKRGAFCYRIQSGMTTYELSRPVVSKK